MIWNRFTEHSLQVVFYAQEEAARLGENYVGAEHFLLALCRYEGGECCRVLLALGVNPGAVKAHVAEQLTPGDKSYDAQMQLTPMASRAIDQAREEARTLGDNFIGTEHLLLGLLHEDGFVSRTLAPYGVTHAKVKEAVLAMRAEAKTEVVA